MRKKTFVMKKKDKVVPDEQVRVNCPLDKEIHYRLRMEAFRKGLSIPGMISRLVADNTPPA